jgi:hypothetical protein
MEPLSTIEIAQGKMCAYFSQTAQQCSPEEGLTLFRQVFVEFTKHDSSIELSTSLITLLLSNREQAFQETLKRVCYILINDWWIQRQQAFIGQLIEQFDDPLLKRHSTSKVMQRLRSWIYNFKISQDFKDLNLYVVPSPPPKSWQAFYTPYLLAHHYLNPQNPAEQRQIARLIAYDRKMTFRYELATFKSRYRFNQLETTATQNPSMLNESTLFIGIKKILIHRKLIGAGTLRQNFYQPLHQKTFVAFKEALLRCFIYSLKYSRIVALFKTEVSKRLMGLYTDQNDDRIDTFLVTKTCKRIVEMLTSETHQTTAPLLNMFLSENCSLELALLLGIIALLCPDVKEHIDFCMGNLVLYGQRLQAKDVQVMINFLELFRVVGAIYEDYDHYNLVKVGSGSTGPQQVVKFGTYRVFSHWGNQESAQPL